MNRGSSEDLVAALKDHHVRADRMMGAIVDASSNDRVVVFRRLRRFLAAHEAAEEVFLHANASRVLDNADVAEQRIQEEADAGQRIATLEGIDVDSAEFDRLFGELRTAIRKHARTEELRELPDVIAACSPSDIERMRQALDHVDLIASRRHGPLGEDDQSFEMMLHAARAEFRALRSELTV